MKIYLIKSFNLELKLQFFFANFVQIDKKKVVFGELLFCLFSRIVCFVYLKKEISQIAESLVLISS